MTSVTLLTCYRRHAAGQWLRHHTTSRKISEFGTRWSNPNLSIHAILLAALAPGFTQPLTKPSTGDRKELWRMASSGMLRRVALGITDVSEELSASFIRITRIGELGTTLAVTNVNISFIDRSRYFFIEVATQLSSRGWMDPVPDQLLLRTSGNAGNRTRDLWVCTQELWPLDDSGSL
jgi:hypothetical protein